jgi:hypothetical protein
MSIAFVSTDQVLYWLQAGIERHLAVSRQRFLDLLENERPSNAYPEPLTFSKNTSFENRNQKGLSSFTTLPSILAEPERMIRQACISIPIFRRGTSRPAPLVTLQFNPQAQKQLKYMTCKQAEDHLQRWFRHLGATHFLPYLPFTLQEAVRGKVGADDTKLSILDEWDGPDVAIGAMNLLLNSYLDSNVTHTESKVEGEDAPKTSFLLWVDDPDQRSVDQHFFINLIRFMAWLCLKKWGVLEVNPRQEVKGTAENRYHLPCLHLFWNREPEPMEDGMMDVLHYTPRIRTEAKHAWYPPSWIPYANEAVALLARMFPHHSIQYPTIPHPQQAILERKIVRGVLRGFPTHEWLVATWDDTLMMGTSTVKRLAGISSGYPSLSQGILFPGAADLLSFRKDTKFRILVSDSEAAPLLKRIQDLHLLRAVPEKLVLTYQHNTKAQALVDWVAKQRLTESIRILHVLVHDAVDVQAMEAEALALGKQGVERLVVWQFQSPFDASADPDPSWKSLLEEEFKVLHESSLESKWIPPVIQFLNQKRRRWFLQLNASLLNTYKNWKSKHEPALEFKIVGMQPSTDPFQVPSPFSLLVPLILTGISLLSIPLLDRDSEWVQDMTRTTWDDWNQKIADDKKNRRPVDLDRWKEWSRTIIRANGYWDQEKARHLYEAMKGEPGQRAYVHPDALERFMNEWIRVSRQDAMEARTFAEFTSLYLASI